MKTKKILVSILGVFAMALFLFAPTQSMAYSQGPMISNSFAVNQGYYGYPWKIYIKAEDPTGNMSKIVTWVYQPGWGSYFPDTVRVSRQDRHNLVGYLQWNTFSNNANSIRDFTNITLKVAVFDKAGDESNVAVFPFEFISAGVPNYKLPSPFNKHDPRLGYIDTNLYNPYTR
jgi:hypothetical protein